jgi:hypothetical protein
LFVLVLCSFGSALAQTDKGEWKRPKHSGKITVEYETAKEQTNLKLGLLPVTCVKDGCVFISIDSSFAGTKLMAPIDRFVFGISIITKTLKPFSEPKLVLRLDGQSVDFGDMTFAGEVPADGLTGLPYGISLTGDQLEKIAAPRKVEVDLAGFRFPFNENVLNAIKDYNHHARTVQ